MFRLFPSFQLSDESLDLVPNHLCYFVRILGKGTLVNHIRAF